jgi:hypothetical protein
MTLRRRIGALSMSIGAVALVLGLTVSPAHAVTPQKVGWWFQPLTGPLALPLPVPVVPDGGMFVQQGATAEPIAFGAVRYNVPEGSNNSLTLTAAPGSVALAASMQACKTSATWEATPGGPGSWDSRPSFGNPCAPGLVASDGSAVAFNLNSSFVSGGALDVAIVPLTAAAPFAVAFAPPADDALTSSGGKQSLSPPLPTTTTVPGASGGSSGTGGGSAAAPFNPSTGAPASAAAAPASSGRNPVADNVLNVVGLGDPDRGARAAALGGASLIVVGWWLLSTQAVPLPRLLGGVGAGTRAAGAAGAAPVDEPSEKKPLARIGGVGRFARNRAGNALKLR